MEEEEPDDLSTCMPGQLAAGRGFCTWVPLPQSICALAFFNKIGIHRHTSKQT